MHTKPTEPKLDFDYEIKELKTRLETRYPLICSDKCFVALLGFVRAKETNYWFDKIAGLNGSGGSDSSGGPSLEIQK